MYTQEPKDAKKRDFKFLKKPIKPAPALLKDLASELSIEWPRLLEPVLQPLQETKTKCFYSVVDKVKGHILANNLKVLLDSYSESSDVHKTQFLFDKALKKWQERELFTFSP